MPEFKKDIFYGMAIGGLVGYLGLQTLGTTPENKKTLANMGVGIGAATGAAYQTFMSNSQTIDGVDYEKMTQENAALKIKVDEFQKQMNLELISKGATDSDKTPPELREYLKKGRWERYRLQRWNQDPEDENIFYKVTEQIKLIPKEGEE